jgi:hypothetical protein
MLACVNLGEGDRIQEHSQQNDSAHSHMSSSAAK